MKKTTNNNETITVKVFGNAIAENIGIWDYSNTKKYSNWIGRMTDKDGKVEYFKKSYDEDLYFYFPKNLKAGDILKAGCTMIYKKRSENAYYAVIEVTEDSITLLEETTYLKATKAYNEYVEKMAELDNNNDNNNESDKNKTTMRKINNKDNNETVDWTDWKSLVKINIDARNSLIRNTEDYYNIFEVMIGKNKFQPLSKKDNYYDITGIGVGDILREGGEDSNGNTWIVGYYLVTKIENGIMEVVVDSSVRGLNKSIESYGIERLAEKKTEINKTKHRH